MHLRSNVAVLRFEQNSANRNVKGIERICYQPATRRKHCYCAIPFGLNRRARGGFKNKTSLDILFKSQDISSFNKQELTYLPPRLWYTNHYSTCILSRQQVDTYNNQITFAEHKTGYLQSTEPILTGFTSWLWIIEYHLVYFLRTLQLRSSHPSQSRCSY
jgi:hypothetical protein